MSLHRIALTKAEHKLNVVAEYTPYMKLRAICWEYFDAGEREFEMSRT